MKKFDFQAFDGMVLPMLDGSRTLIDTGCPVSFGPGRSFPSFGMPSLPDSLMGVTVETVSELLGGPQIHALMGCDLLSQQPFMIDWSEKSITFSPDEISEGIDIPLDHVMGLPVVTARMKGRVLRLAADTGCKCFYLVPELLADSTVTGTVDDHHYSCGRFRAETCSEEIEIGQVTFNLPLGKLPSTLAAGMRSLGLDGLVGNSIFEDGRYSRGLYDLAESKLTLLS